MKEIKSILDMVISISDLTAEVDLKFKKQNDLTGNITINITSIEQSFEKINAGYSEISAVTEEQLAIFESMQQKAEEMSETKDVLSEVISEFKGVD